MVLLHCAQYESSRGLMPKRPGSFKHCFRCGEVVNESTGRVLRSGEDAVVGESEVNAVLRHQIDPDSGFRDSGISTTLHYARAEFYATRGHTGQSGYVLTFDRELLKVHEVRALVVREILSNPTLPEDDEVILVASDGGALPEGIVINATKV